MCSAPHSFSLADACIILVAHRGFYQVRAGPYDHLGLWWLEGDLRQVAQALRFEAFGGTHEDPSRR